MARPLLVLGHSVCWEPKGPEREVGTGQSERGPCCLATGSWLGACLPHSPGIKLYLSPVWLHCLLFLSGFPSRQALRTQEGQAGVGPGEGGSCRLCCLRDWAVGWWSGWVFPSGSLPSQASVTTNSYLRVHRRGI